MSCLPQCVTSKFFERCNIHHPTPFDGRHQHFRRKASRCRGYSAHPTTTIQSRKAYQQRAEAATAIGNAAALYKCVFVLTFVPFVESTELRSTRGWRRWIIQRAQPLYWRAHAVAVEATYRGDNYAARTVRFLPAFFCTTILLTGQYFYFSSKFNRTS